MVSKPCAIPDTNYIVYEETPFSFSPIDSQAVCKKYNLTYENGGWDKIADTTYYDWAQTQNKNVLVVPSGLKQIVLITPQMSIDEIHQKLATVEAQERALRDKKQEIAAKKQEEFDKSLPAIEWADEALMQKIVAANRQAPQKEFMPREFSTDASIRIRALERYVGALQKVMNEKGCITKGDILSADNASHLSIHFNFGGQEMRFEASRFWADVVLLRTWKYGNQLFKAEGFTQQQTDFVRGDENLPLTFPAYENLGHPFMKDLRVLDFAAKPKQPEKVMAHQDPSVSLDNQNTRQ